MKKAQNVTDTRVPASVWAWQGLRRNNEYRRLFAANKHYGPKTVKLRTGATLLRLHRRCRDAETFGLIYLADPNRSAIDANVFWRSDVLAGSLRVNLAPSSETPIDVGEPHDKIVLSALNTNRTLLETCDGVRHILLYGERFWVQLYCENPTSVGENAVVKIRIDGASHAMRRLDTAAQLLSLHRSTGEKLSLIGRRKTPTSIIRALGAFDIWHGFERPKGDLQDVAEFLSGSGRMEKDWDRNDRNLRVQARRWVERGEKFVTSGYLSLLSRKSL